MPGFANSDNKFGPTPFIVDPVVGNGATYSTIQSAIDAAYATGTSQTVYVRVNEAGYNENLVLHNKVNIEGIQPTGNVGPGMANPVTVNGNHTLNTDVDGGGGCKISNINFVSSLPGYMFTITSAIADTSALYLKDCTVFSFSAGGITSVTFNFCNIENCYFETDGICFDWVAGMTCSIKGGSYQCDADIVIHAFGVNGTSISDAILVGNTSVVFVEHGGAVAMTRCSTQSNDSMAIFNAGGSVSISNSSIGCVAPSGFIAREIAGGGSIFSYVDITLSGTAFLIDPVVIQSVTRYWEPYCSTTPSPGNVGVRGTSCFDNTQFSVVDGFVQLLGGTPAHTFVPDDLNPVSPDGLGALNVRGDVGTTNVPSGIETHNDPTANTMYIEDRRWVSAYIVDASTTIGLRGEYSTIQSAIDAANATTNQETVYIRPGLYIENLVLRPRVALIGLTTAADGTSSIVQINGEHVGNDIGYYHFENINFFTSDPADTFTFSSTISNFYMRFEGCSITNLSQSCIVLQGDDSNNLRANNCTFSGAQFELVIGGTANSFATFTNCTSGASTSGVSINAPGSAVNVYYADCKLAYFNVPTNIATASSVTYRGCDITAQQAFTAVATAFIAIYDCMVDISVAPTWTSGAFFLQWADVKFPDVVVPIDPATIEQRKNCQPYGKSGTSCTSYRGTSGFYATSFDVTDGFVQPIGGGIGTGKWLDAAAPITTDRGVNYFADAGGALTLTLETTPIQGDHHSFDVISGTTLTIQTAGTQVIQIGGSSSSAGGTATSTGVGDSIDLVYRLSDDTWHSIGGPEGTWTLA